jgi:hypothetical protein
MIVIVIEWSHQTLYGLHSHGPHMDPVRARVPARAHTCAPKTFDVEGQKLRPSSSSSSSGGSSISNSN